MKPHVIFILLLFSSGWRVSLFAQKEGRALADSLLKDMGSKSDTVKVKRLVNISRIYMHFNYDTGILYSNEGLKLAQSVNWKKGIGLCNENSGTLYRLKAEYPEALDCYFKALKCYEEINWKIGISVCYNNIAIVFQYQEKYAEAVKYNILALEIVKELDNQNSVASIYGDIGILFWRRRNFDSALLYSFRSLKIYDSLNEKREIARTNGNIGLIYGETKNFDKALEYDFRSLEVCRKLAGGQREMSIRWGNIALVYLKAAQDSMQKNMPGKFIPAEVKAKLSKALLYVDSAIEAGKKMDALYELQEDKKTLANVEEMLGNYKSAYESYKEYIDIRDSVFSTENKVKIARAEAKHELELKEKQIRIGQLELGKAQNEKWFLIAGILLLTIIGILFVNQQRLLRKKLVAEKKNAESELEMAAMQLNNFKQSIQEKNSLIEQASKEIAALKTGAEQKTDDEALSQLERSIILTDEQWEDFRVVFEKVHNGFFKRVKEKMPDLTPAEIRFVALSKLKLSPKEMASMLGISSGSIRNYRHRLRRKLGLSEDASIEEIAGAI